MDIHTVPHPGGVGYETWPEDAWKTVGGANVWTEFSLDEERGIVYHRWPGAKYNFYRWIGKEAISSAIVWWL